MKSRVHGRRTRWAVILTRTIAAGAVMAVALVIAPATARAQAPVESFDRLNTRVTVGDTVIVTDAQGRQVTGQIFALKDASITIVGVGTTTLPADRVRLVERRCLSLFPVLGPKVKSGGRHETDHRVSLLFAADGVRRNLRGSGTSRHVR